MAQARVFNRNNIMRLEYPANAKCLTRMERQQNAWRRVQEIDELLDIAYVRGTAEAVARLEKERKEAYHEYMTYRLPQGW